MDCKCAFGAEDINNAVKLEKKYRNLGVWIEKAEQDTMYFPLSAMYLAKYNISDYCLLYDALECNWDAMREDIEARLEVH